jgi:hypothetical protein
VDGICCTESCSACQACTGAGGTCVSIGFGGEDNVPGGTCVAPNACNGSGGCKRKSGQACGSDGTVCLTGLCVDGVCCDSTCTGTCRSCALAGSAGTCSVVRNGVDTGTCTSPSMCDSTGSCSTPQVDAAVDMAAPAFCQNYVAGSGMLAGKSASEFCTYYASVCTYGAADRYASMADCMTKYAGATTSAQTCRAGHLCNAAAGSPAIHCVHATGINLCQ